jgi:hypothetical protein
MTRWLIIGGLIAFGLLLSFWPAVTDSVFTVTVLLIILLTLYLLFSRAWLPFFLALIACYFEIRLTDGIYYNIDWTMFDLFFPLIWLIVLCLSVWLLIRKEWWWAGLSFFITWLGIFIIGLISI